MPKIESKGSPVSEDTVKLLRTQNCTVYYEKSVTKNMGDFNSAKITVGVTLPIDPSKEEVVAIRSTLRVGDDIVTREIEKQVDELLESE